MKKVVTLHPEKRNIPMHDRRLRVAAYCRVSTEHEEQDGSIELQENYFRAVIDGNRNWTNAGIFSERTTGLKLKSRKQFNAMIRKCKSGKIDLILTKSISRFGRNTFDELKTLQDLRVLGVDVYFEQEKLWLHVRKNIDYSEMYEELDMLMAMKLPQMELYCEIGKAVCRRAEKGAAVMASEYLNKQYPDVKGFSPRSLRRMRDFYRTYESYPALLSRAMNLGWIQNVVIMEADLTMELREWYMKAAKQFGWSKTELIANLSTNVHEDILKCVQQGELFTLNYPLLIEHILREAKLYQKYTEILEREGDLSERYMKDTECFWNQIMMEHAQFIRGLLDPCETELFCAADGFAKEYCKLLEAGTDAHNKTSGSDSLAQTLKFRDFKAIGTKGIQQNKIRSIILPLLADHVLREANHYIRLLQH